MTLFKDLVFLRNRLRLSSIILLLAVALTGCTATAGQQPSEPRPTTTSTVLPPATSPTPIPSPTDLPPPSPTAAVESSPTPTPPPTDQLLPLPTVAVESATTATAGLSSTPTSAPAAIAVAVTADLTAAPLADSNASAAGLKVYKEQYCGICHKLDAAGTGGIFGPEQNHIGTMAEARIKNPNYRGQAGTAADYLRESILEPGAYFVEGYEQSAHHMPAYTHLNDAQVDALVQMLLQQK